MPGTTLAKQRGCQLLVEPLLERACSLFDAVPCSALQWQWLGFNVLRPAVFMRDLGHLFDWGCTACIVRVCAHCTGAGHIICCVAAGARLSTLLLLICLAKALSTACCCGCLTCCKSSWQDADSVFERLPWVCPSVLADHTHVTSDHTFITVHVSALHVMKVHLSWLTWWSSAALSVGPPCCRASRQSFILCFVQGTCIYVSSTPSRLL